MRLQFLAWNGGGATNYNDIVEEGGYDASSKHASAEVTLDKMVGKAEKLTEELGAIYSEIKGAFVA